MELEEYKDKIIYFTENLLEIYKKTNVTENTISIYAVIDRMGISIADIHFN